MQLPSPIGQNPSLPEPFTNSAFKGLGGGSQVVLPVNAVNSDSTTFLPTGNFVNVTAGVPCTIHFKLCFLTAAIGGIKLQLIHPGFTASSGFLYDRFSAGGATTFTEQLQTVGASPALFTSAVMTYTGLGQIDFYLTFTPSATGTVDIAFAPNVNTQVITLLAGSYVEIANKQFGT